MKELREVVVVAATRTGIGRAKAGVGQFRDVHPSRLLGTVYRDVIARAGLEARLVDLAITGCVQSFGSQGANIARMAWLQEGLPATTAGVTVDLRCGSSLQAMHLAAGQIAAGAIDTAVVGGLEHMGTNSFAVVDEIQQKYGTAYTAEFLQRYPVRGQGIGAELIADDWGITRADMDAFAARSHQLAAKATADGLFEREIVPVEVDGLPVVDDQGIRPETTSDSLATLKPAFKPDGRITAASSSQMSDGAAALLLMSKQRAAELGIRPRARVVDHVAVGCDPVKMLEGPLPATEALLRRNRMLVSDIEVSEVNEAFASVVLAWLRRFDADPSTVNRRGGAIALGHPLGASGARLVTTLVRLLEDEDKELGLVTMCCGGGAGVGTLLQRI
jgi:acetyl-CoA acyltransferase